MEIPFFQVDAFTTEVFRGNPAALCLLERPLPDATLQAIAAEHNLSETAFLLPGEGGAWNLRWFTPKQEVDLCGHATLAAGYVLHRHRSAEGPLRFATRSGVLTVAPQPDGAYLLDLPAIPSRRAIMNDQTARHFGAPGTLVLCQTGKNFMALLPSEAHVRDFVPNLSALASLPGLGVIITARGDTCDFVSRYFCPKAGIPEDPVTGSAHAELAPFWGRFLDKTSLHARQLSPRGGELQCRLEGDRVHLVGHAALYAHGTVHLPA